MGICLRNIQIILHEFNKLSKICVAFEWKPDFKELWSFWAHQTIHWETELRSSLYTSSRKQEKAIKKRLYVHSTRFQWRIKTTRSCDRPQIAWQKTSSKIAQFRTLQTLKRINSVGIHKALFYVHDICYHMRKTKAERTRYTNTDTVCNTLACFLIFISVSIWIRDNIRAPCFILSVSHSFGSFSFSI